DAHYVVCSYDFVRALHKNKPKHFAVLQEWVRLKILDEGHLVDNPKSKRSQAIQALNSERTVVLTATPYQHQKKRVATLLSHALPKKFPDPVALAHSFKADKDFAREVVHHHGTFCSIEDV